MRSQSELRLRPESAAPGLARAAIAAAASGLPTVMVADAELLTSELVSNAVRHAELDPSQEIVVRIVADGNVRVEVADPGPPFDADLREPSTASSGWGLLLLDAIATSWGVELEGSGKRVWFEVGGVQRQRALADLGALGIGAVLRVERDVVRHAVEVRDGSVDPDEVQHPPNAILFAVQDEASAPAGTPPPAGRRRCRWSP